MNITHLHSTFASFFYYIENFLIQNTQAYRNHTSKLYYQPDTRLGTGYVSYASPFKQWVADQSVSGAYINNGISGDITLSRGESGMRVDYGNGRVILNSSLGKGLNISGSYAFKDLNFYLSNETEESLLTNTHFYLNARNQPPINSGVSANSFVTPCIFCTVLNSDNTPFALGGQELSQSSFSLIVYAETVWQLNGVMSAFSDAARKSFPLLDLTTGSPISVFGDVKTGIFPSGYSYQKLKCDNFQPGRLMYIEDVKCSKLSDKTDMNPEVFAGLAQFTVSIPRIT